MKTNSIELKEISWPNFGISIKPPEIELDELLIRLDKVRIFMDKIGLTHLIVYGDREHFANLMYLTWFDPRFEESILVIKKDGKPLILVGNECKDYLRISPLRLKTASCMA